MSLTKTILNQYFAGFLLCLGQRLLWNKENINQLGLFELGKWNNRHPVFYFLKFMLGFRFSFEAYAKNVREKAAKCSLKQVRFYRMLTNICLPKFDIYSNGCRYICYPMEKSKYFSNP